MLTLQKSLSLHPSAARCGNHIQGGALSLKNIRTTVTVPNRGRYGIHVFRCQHIAIPKKYYISCKTIFGGYNKHLLLLQF
jgi:hypothetical protein